MPPPHAQLSALVALISDATKVVESCFAKTSKPYVPSLDDIELHPFDTLPHTMELRIAIQTIEGACGQLLASIGRPANILLNKALIVTEPACLSVIAANKIPELLHEKPEKGMHISEIAQRTGLPQKKLARIMRHLVTKHIFRESEDDVFVNNRLSINLVRTHTPGMADLVLYNTNQLLGAVSCFNDVLTDAEWGHSDAPNHTAFNKHTGYAKSLFEYYEGNDSEKGAELGQRFATMMNAWAISSEAEAVVYDFPWKDLRMGTTIVDVGSGVGVVPLKLAKKYPRLKFVLQDTPERMLQAKEEVWPKEYPEAIAEGRVEFKEIDFFKNSPVPGADIYYIRHIIHDWEDQLCVTILRNVRKAMTPDSRLLIHEYVLKDTARNSSANKYGVKKAPEPLLPNYGMGGVKPYSLDISMMVMFNSVERRLNDLIVLGEEANLKFVTLWNVGETCLVEFALPQGRASRKIFEA